MGQTVKSCPLLSLNHFYYFSFFKVFPKDFHEQNRNLALAIQLSPSYSGSPKKKKPKDR